MARSYLHDYMPAIRNLSDKTIETYKQSLKTYLRFLKEKKNIEDEIIDIEDDDVIEALDFFGIRI